MNTLYYYRGSCKSLLSAISLVINNVYYFRELELNSTSSAVLAALDLEFSVEAGARRRAAVFYLDKGDGFLGM